MSPHCIPGLVNALSSFKYSSRLNCGSSQRATAFCMEGHWGPERWSNLPKVTEREGAKLETLDSKINAKSSHVCSWRFFCLLSLKRGACTGLKQHSKINLRPAPGQPPALTLQKGDKEWLTHSRSRLRTDSVWKRPSPTSSEIDNDGSFSLKSPWHRHTKSSKSELGKKKKTSCKIAVRDLHCKPPYPATASQDPDSGDPLPKQGEKEAKTRRQIPQTVGG